jgi:integrating conjugative element protein (TIGR03757 family)
VEQWEKKFSEGLPVNEKEARLEIARKIERMGGQEVFDNQVLDAYAPLARAVEIGLNEYPSVVINGTYVVYGTDSVAVALERYKTWTTNN